MLINGITISIVKGWIRTIQPMKDSMANRIARLDNFGISDHWIDRPDKDFCEFWFAKLKEVIDNYRPDLLWFDFDLQWVQDKYKRKLAAYYYNAAEEWGREVEIIYKDHDLPPHVGLLDYERGAANKLTWHPWVTDTILGTKAGAISKMKFLSP